MLIVEGNVLTPYVLDPKTAGAVRGKAAQSTFDRDVRLAGELLADGRGSLGKKGPIEQDRVYTAAATSIIRTGMNRALTKEVREKFLTNLRLLDLFHISLTALEKRDDEVARYTIRHLNEVLVAYYTVVQSLDRPALSEFEKNLKKDELWTLMSSAVDFNAHFTKSTTVETGIVRWRRGKRRYRRGGS